MKLIQNKAIMYSFNIPCKLRGAALTSIVACTFAILSLSGSALADEQYGPENLLKTMPNPFAASSLLDKKNNDAVEELGLIELSSSARQPRHTLNERLTAPKFFLPDRLVLGKSSEFLVKGPPGSCVAIARADKDKGAKPVFGHRIRLGPDRKVVTVGKIPESGLLSLFIEAPIEGDLVGSPLYFEAAVWSKPDFSDLVFASCVTPLSNGTEANGVLVAADIEQKKRGLFVLEPGRVHYTSDTTNDQNSSNPY
jgi:hypothetical protein